MFCLEVNLAFSSSTIYISSICLINSSLLSDNLLFFSFTWFYSLCISDYSLLTDSSLDSYSPRISLYFSIWVFASLNWNSIFDKSIKVDFWFKFCSVSCEISSFSLFTSSYCDDLSDSFSFFWSDLYWVFRSSIFIFLLLKLSDNSFILSFLIMISFCNSEIKTLFSVCVCSMVEI